MSVTFEYLLEKYLQDTLEPEEVQLFIQMAQKKENQQTVLDALHRKLANSRQKHVSDAGELDDLFQQMLLRAEQREQPVTIDRYSAKSPKWYYTFAKAAAVILIIAAAGIYFWPKPSVKNQVSQKPENNQVQPGGNKAILTLADGSEIVLNDAANGALATQGDVTIVKAANGQLIYKLAGGTGNNTVYNTMKTPRGGQYQLLLEDGTHVWLNASSSITFPTTFKNDERVVVLKGEAFFEVAKNANKPFKVTLNGMEIKVLGTQFNVNGYDDEQAIKTTLIEGSVQISNGSSTALLKPGQQAQVASDGQLKLVQPSDLEEITAWKNGLFSFKDEDIPSIMRQLARWYDVDVQYEGQVSKRKFTGQVFRHLNLSEALKVLELNDVHFRIEGKKVTVLQ